MDPVFHLCSDQLCGWRYILVKGQQVLVGISDYHVDHPNVYGNLLYITAGFLMFTAGVLCIRFLLPLCLQPLFRPLIIAVKHLAGRYQETDAHFAGMIRKEVTTDSTDYFPLFVFHISARKDPPSGIPLQT